MATNELATNFPVIKATALGMLTNETVRQQLGTRASAIASVLHSAYVVQPNSHGTVYVPPDEQDDNGLGVIFRSTFPDEALVGQINVGPYFGNIPPTEAERIRQSQNVPSNPDSTAQAKISNLFKNNVLSARSPRVLATFETDLVVQDATSHQPNVIQSRSLVVFDDMKSDKLTLEEAALGMIHVGDHEVQTRQTIVAQPTAYTLLHSPVIATWHERSGYYSQYVAQAATTDTSSLPSVEQLARFDYDEVEAAIDLGSLPRRIRRLVRPTIAVAMSQKYGDADMTELPTDQEVTAYKHLRLIRRSKR